MSNILIIKHGSLGDIAQACGAIQDISENHKDDEVHLLTTKPYFDLFKKNPNILNVILDKRLPRFNLIYLYSLMKNIKKYKFSKVYDLQNSSRTAFYKRILSPNATKDTWSSTETTLPEGTIKEDFDKDSVLSRFDHQLKSSGIITRHTLNPDFSWSLTDISQIKNYHQLEKYIVLFPFCSPHLTSKKWPYYNDLISMINERLENKFKVVIAPGPGEIKDASSINAICVLDNGKALDISQLAGVN
jgi:ADP-heptose:LPS heptosyltransferase